MRLEAEAALRAQITKERDALKGVAGRPLTDQYRDFLQERAQDGDERALRELRRMQQIHRQTKRLDDERAERAIAFGLPSPGTRQPGPMVRNEIIYNGPSITYEVRASGEVDYRKDGAAFLVDEGRTLRLLDDEREAIEIALRFAQQKFGSTLSLSGPDDFQAAAAKVAAESRMRVVFEQPELEQIRRYRLAELDAETADRRTATQARGAAERDQLRDAIRQPVRPAQDGPGETRSDHDSGEPDGPDQGPDIDQ